MQGAIVRETHIIYPRRYMERVFEDRRFKVQLSVAAGDHHFAERYFPVCLPFRIFARHDVGEMTFKQAFSIGRG